MSNWQKVRLGDVCSFQNGFAFKSGEFDLKGDSCVVKIKELKDGEVKLFEDSSRINYSSNWGKYIINYDDVVVALTGDPVNKNNPLSWVGRVAINKNSDRLLLNQRVAKFCPDTNKLNSKFIYCYFRVFDNFYDLAQKATGSASQANISTKTIEDTVVFLPTLAEQERIAGILGALDDKIECNNRINRNLEEQAAVLFRSWFVDFEFPDPTSPTYGKPYRSAGGTMQDSPLGSIPQGWQVGKINDIAKVVYGAPYKSKLFNNEGNGLPLIRIRDLKTNTPQFYTPEILPNTEYIIAGDIVVGMDAEFRPYIWFGSKGVLNQRVCKFIPIKEEISNYFVYSIIKPHLEFIEFHKVGTTVSHIGKSDIDKIEIIIPKSDILLKFTQLINPVFNQLITNKKENQTLITLRDSLLPKLMNNELSLDELPL